MVSDLSSKGVVNLVSNEVRQIYSLLEADFTPLELCQRLAPLLEKLETVTEPMSGMIPCLVTCLKSYVHTEALTTTAATYLQKFWHRFTVYALLAFFKPLLMLMRKLVGAAHLLCHWFGVPCGL